MDDDTWYERGAWIFFALLCGTALPLALLIYVAPSSAHELWARFGYDLPPTIAADPAALRHVEHLSHWAATGTIGFDLFGLLIAVTAFRRGERWAWMAFWYWPVLFATHFVTYTSGFRHAQLLWLALSVLALLATYRKVWTRTAVEAELAVGR
jgi:hypothetical protein